MARLLSPTAPRAGSVLIVVLWASVGLVSIALLFGNSMAMNYRGSDNDLAGRQADAAIEGAIRYAEALLAEQTTPGTLPDFTSYEAEAMTVGEAEFWILGRADGDASATTREYGLVDEASKLNLNTVPTGVLAQLPGMTDELVAAIDEWRSPPAGSTTGDDGIKHEPFESVDELAHLFGMTRTILYGEDTNLNGVLDGNEDDADASEPPDNADGKLDPGLAEYFTTFTEEPSDQPGGAGPRLNVLNLNSPNAVTAVTTLLDTAVPGHAPVTIQAAAYPSVIDFLATSGISTALSEEEIDKLVPYLVSGDLTNPAQPGAPLLMGLVNVNTASETVLAALVGADVAANLIAERLGRAAPSTGLAWAVPLLRNVQPPGNLRYLTGQSYQVSADIAAVGRHGRGYRRARVVIDTRDADAGPRVIYRRNLAPLGWALGRDVRQTLALRKDLR